MEVILTGKEDMIRVAVRKMMKRGDWISFPLE